MKKIVFALVVLLFTIPVTAQAHTVLSSSNPEEGQNITEPLNEISLVFETQIETGSTISLESAGQSFSLEEIVASGNTLQGRLAEQDLPNGEYVIQWSIVGADGHPIKGNIAFNLELNSDAAEPVGVEKSAEKAQSVEKAAPMTDVQKAGTAEQQEPFENSLLVTILLVIIAIAIIAMAIGVFKKTKTPS